VGTWWNAEHQLDVVGLDQHGKAAVVGEAKWRNRPFAWDDLTTYLSHTRALGNLLLPDAQHLLFSKSGLEEPVQRWARGVGARLLTPANLLAPFE
jgi:hypothetical protein